MGKKSGDRVSWESICPQKRAQVTVFIIVGLVITFVFLFLISLTSQVKKNELEMEKEAAISKVLQKEALRIYVEDCLKDSLTEGLLLVGRQGRLWRDQPGGTRNFEEGVTGVRISGEEQGGRVFYALTREDENYPWDKNAYPCESDSSSPVFCGYRYPNTSIGYGLLKLKTSTIKEDLQRYLVDRTLKCVENFTKEKISPSVEIKTKEMALKLDLLDEGISIKVDYPLTLSLGKEEYFHLATFDFFYPTQFNELLKVAVAYPLEWDHQYLDFNYTKETLEQPGFSYSSREKLTNCQPVAGKGYFACLQPTFFDLYKSLGVKMETQTLENGDDLFTFKSAAAMVQSPEEFVFRLARQNRPPALDYVNRLACLGVPQPYDYLVIKDDKELGRVNISPFAWDADEDKVSYSFNDQQLPGEKKENIFLAKPTQEGNYFLTVSAWDEHGLSDSQVVRILVDRPLEAELSLEMPYLILNEGKYISWKDYQKLENKYIVSKEDPVFLKVSLPQQSAVAKEAQAKVSYVSSLKGNVLFATDLTAPYNAGEKNFCFNFPWYDNKKGTCQPEDYSNIISWKGFDYNPFTEKGKLKLDFSVNYCGGAEQSSSWEKEVAVVGCIPHFDPTHPYPYLPNDQEEFYKYEFGLNALGGTNYSDFKGKKEISPFLAAHTCCDASDRMPKKAGAECFTNPLPNCYGGIKDYTALGFGGYVLERQYAVCDGKRGNLCTEKKYELWNNELVCGDNSLSACGKGGKKIASACQNKKAFDYVYDEKGQALGWCSGTMGCETLCKGEVVDVLKVTPPKNPVNFNERAKTKLITNSQDLGFSCGCVEKYKNSPCDKNWDKMFKGTCQLKENKWGCVGDA